MMPIPATDRSKKGPRKLTTTLTDVKLLILGGTAFVGRHLVEAAVAGGHEPVLFTRGRTNPGLFPGVEHLVGDRETDLSPLDGREFDAVLDTSGYLPRVVRASAGLLAGRAQRYVFVSSISVYDEAPVLSESTPTWHPADPESEDVNRDYGGLKTLCEEAVRTAFGDERALIVRPGLIVGSHDYTGRFSYWPHRVARGGEVLAPEPAAARVWFVDVRDLAEWAIRMVERRSTGVYNVAGPEPPISLGEVLDECRALTGSDACFTWVGEELLAEQGVAPSTELPLWVPGGHPEIDVSRAVAAGLTFRPVAETIRSVLDEGPDAAEPVAFGWDRPRAGLKPERERELLAAWHARVAERAP
jgi:2'-hydroxyisoflavone reductase